MQNRKDRMLRKLELLAPAGNKEAFYGAIHAGADAVYLGGSRFGARAYADNFTLEELVACIRYAHIWGKKVYLTVNTLVKEVEFPELLVYLSPFYEAGLDGVIVQDIGVLSYIREQFPMLELHASTQMTITGEYGAKLLKEMGACRVVPARELSLQEIITMKERTGMEIECFIHGAMCYCYSGQCLYSSILGGRSGNRGRCAQPCRLPYQVKGNKTSPECFPLSLKDMCTIESLPKLIEAGIDSFKIEGRMKKPEYAAGVTAIYRKYIDAYLQAPDKEFQVSKSDLQQLSGLYIRSQRQNGYYFKHNGRDMVTLEHPAYSGSDEGLLAEIRTKYLETFPKLGVSIYADFMTGKDAVVTFVSGEHSVTVTGEVVEAASKQPLSRENIQKQLGKLGGSVFALERMEIHSSEDGFYSLKALNELRRKAVCELEEALIRSHGLTVSRESTYSQQKEEQEHALHISSNSQHGFHIQINTLQQLEALQEFPYKKEISRIYINGDLLYANECQKSLPLAMLQKLIDLNCEMEFIISLPAILRQRDTEYMKNLLFIAHKECDIIKGFLVNSMEAMGYLKKMAYAGKIYADAGFYIWNHWTIHTWEKAIAGFCMPWELKSGEQKALLSTEVPFEKIFYGRIPMMVTANCVVNTTEGCKKGLKDGKAILIDRYHKQFPVVLNCAHCMNIIYNSLPLSLHKEWNKWKEQVDLRLNFTVEDKQETLEVLTFYHQIIGTTADIPCPFKEYTTGHEKRGVE